MSATIIKLLPDEELDILTTYFLGQPENHLEAIFEELDVPEEIDIPRVAIAVAQILLHDIQAQLPSWGYTEDDGSLVSARQPHRRHRAAKLSFNPKHLLTLNWADSGPGFSWPEAYYITYVPTFNQYIVTASRDGGDAYGCSDHAIGFANGDLPILDAAKAVITQEWRQQRNNWDQSRWAYLFSEGLIDVETANSWANEVWDLHEFDDD